jgi:geranylgeranyl diphosphate synthase type 3
MNKPIYILRLCVTIKLIYIIFFLFSFCYQAAEIYVEELLEIHRGEAMDIFWRQNIICPSEADYKTMILRSNTCKPFLCTKNRCIGKIWTLNNFPEIGTLFNLALRLMNLFSSCKEDFSSLISILSLYLQVHDDYYNLCLNVSNII